MAHYVYCDLGFSAHEITHLQILRIFQKHSVHLILPPAFHLPAFISLPLLSHCHSCTFQSKETWISLTWIIVISMASYICLLTKFTKHKWKLMTSRFITSVPKKYFLTVPFKNSNHEIWWLGSQSKLPVYQFNTVIAQREYSQSKA